MIWELFAFTGLVVWAWLAVMTLTLVVVVGWDDSPGWALFWLLLGTGFVVGFTDYRPPSVSLIDVLLLAVVYTGVGVVYGAARWFLLVRQIGVWWRLHEEMAEAYYPNKFKSDRVPRYTGGPPSPADFKTRITNWMAYWPISIVAWAIGDLLVDFWNTIYKWAAGLLQRISNAAWKEGS